MRLEDGEIEDGKMIIDQLLFNKKSKGGGLNMFNLFLSCKNKR